VILHPEADLLPFFRAGHDRTVQDRHALRPVARKVAFDHRDERRVRLDGRTFSGAVRRAQMAVT
jgi:hypothetical protein